MAAKSSDWRPGPTVCRCCFAEGCYKDISTEYFWMGKREVYAEMLTETFDVAISYMKTGGPNSNSRLICEPCISRLRDASDFKRQVVECEKVFTQTLASPEAMVSETEVLIQRLGEKDDIKLERVKVETKVDEDDDFDDRGAFPDDNDDDLDDEPLTKFATKVPKDETVDILDFLETTKPKKPLKRKSSSKVKSAPSKKTKSKEPQPSASKSTAPVEKKKKDISSWEEDMESTRSALVILRNSNVYPFGVKGSSLLCCFCTSVFTDPAIFREHVNSKHARVDRYDLLNPDKQCRLDITGLICKKCNNNDVFESINNFIEHLNEKHDSNIDVARALWTTYLLPVKLGSDLQNNYSCDICNKLCCGMISLVRHTKSHYYRAVCHVCGKHVHNQRYLKNHTKYCQRGVKYYCRYCKEEFSNAKEKAKHTKENWTCALYKCRICKIGFQAWEKKRQHSYEVHGEKQADIRCGDCGMTFHLRTLLFRHFKTVHSKEHTCQYCERTFAVKDALVSHVNNHHTLAKPHLCDVCSKGFGSLRGLNNHIKTHFESMQKQCSVCTKRFVCKSRLNKHIQKSHPDMNTLEH